MNGLNSGWLTMRGNATCGSVVEQTSSIFEITRVLMYPRKFSSRFPLYTSIHPHRLPGRELGDDEMFQMLEDEVMTTDDYELILRQGYARWFTDYMVRVQPQLSPGAWLTKPPEDASLSIEPVSVEPSAMEPSRDEPAQAEAPAPVPDYEAHYTLGIAYKNMGLYEDAMDEFHLSKSADSFYLDSCLMTAL
mgnify:CR=1 FL=1